MMTLLPLAIVAALLPGAEPQARRYHAIESDMRAAMRAEAMAVSSRERGNAVRQLCDVYVELQSDPRRERSETLQQYRAKIHSRLLAIRNALQKEIAREERQSQPSGELLEAENPSDQAAESIAAQLALSSYSFGGPGQLLAGAMGGGGIRDDGPALVELIQKTITPDFWDVNGGPGTIVYYAPLRVLVVRASHEGHGHVGGLLGGLREAGR